MENIMETVNGFVWGAPALILILGVGLYLSVRLNFVQLILFPEALGRFCSQFFPKKSTEGKSSFRALCAALAATVGTGNLVGVAGAICLGGPGAIFWMWICGILGMVTKYSEVVLAVHYRVKKPDGFAGGPMYIITRGLPRKFHFLAYMYALFGCIASFGVGNLTQIHAATDGIREGVHSLGWNTGPVFDLLLAGIFAAVIGVFLLGGAKRIYSVAEWLVPFAAVVYLLLCLGVLGCYWYRIPDVISQIVRGAVSPKAVTGGMIGASFQALRVGCSRGVFTNEAGMGTASIAHSGADTTHPVRQGMMGIMEVFLDTLVICTVTALVILVSGVPIPYGTDAGGILTSRAFAVVYGQYSPMWLALVITLLAVAAVMGWGLYGARCAQFLFGSRAWRWFCAMQIVTIVAGAFLQTSTVWLLAESVNGLMAIPNLITLAVLTPEVVRLTKDYKKTGAVSAGGGNYANFYQRKPL